MDLFSIGGAFLRDKLKSHASVQIQYQRGDDSITPFATRGNSSWDASVSDNSAIKVNTADFVMAVNQFDDFGLPEEGDLIIDNGFVYELLDIDAGQFFRYCDTPRTLIRVHTKQVQ